MYQAFFTDKGVTNLSFLDTSKIDLSLADTSEFHSESPILVNSKIDFFVVDSCDFQPSDIVIHSDIMLSPSFDFKFYSAEPWEQETSI